MNLTNTLRTWVVASLGLASMAAFAQDKPTILTVPANNGGGLVYLSRNGQWACGDAPNVANESLRGYPRIVNTASGEETLLWTEEDDAMGTPMGVNAVSDDGKTAVGNYRDLPAVWTEAKGWQQLELPNKNYNNGLVSDVTPDGKYGVGRVSIGLWNERACMWDLETLKLVNLPGMVSFNPMYFTINAELEERWLEWEAKFKAEHPDYLSNKEESAKYYENYQAYIDAQYSDSDLNVRLTGISPDGNAVLGMVDFAYPAACWEFVYYVDKAEWKPLGMKFEDNELIPLDSDVMNGGANRFSADGSYIGGTYYSVSDTEVPFICQTYDSDNFTAYKDTDNMLVTLPGSDGILYGATPVSTPLRDWSARVGYYWYDWKSVLKQIYGIDWLDDITKDETGYSGTLSGVSKDNLTLLATDYGNGTSYLITLPKPMKEICEDFDLLADYRVSPVDGAQFSKLQTVTVAFSRNVKIAAEQNGVQLLDEKGEPVRSSINIAPQITNPRNVDITFRPTALEPGVKYTLLIPAGAIQVDGDEERVNKEIRISYTGRANAPVKVESVFPEDGSELPRLSYTTNPILVTFDAIIDAVDNGGSIRLYQVKDGEEEYLFNLSAAINGRQMLVYPVSEQRLAEGFDYKIVFEAGVVADLSGEGDNEEFTLTYHGSYVPEVDPTSNIIYKNTFEGTLGEMLLYEGDHNTPTEEMKKYGFETDNTPWWYGSDEVNEEEVRADHAAMSHSQYDPAGKSDDWMVTPQLYIPDDKATLTFKSQGFRKSKKDYLKVYIYESDDIYTFLTANVIDKIHYEGKEVYNELQDPGESEDDLACDWRENSISLAEYAGKNIYIAFLNDNQNQSIVFVDDVIVSREVIALLGVDNETTAFDQDNVIIKGRAIIEKVDGLDSFTITLADGDGNLLQTIEETEPQAKGTVYTFEFPEAVALEKGCVNSFDITLTSGEQYVTYRLNIKNMVFRAQKKIVVEEYTGTGCQFCPLGILALEKMQEVYGDLVIPVAIHAYTGGDVFKTSEQEAYAQFYNFQGAPQAVINRGEVCGPMYNDGKGYSFTDPVNGLTWIDKAEQELKTLAEAEVEINDAIIDGDKVKVDFSANFALDRTDANINVFAVLMEDGLRALQSNALSGTEDPNLGDWGKGGANDKSSVIWTYDDVVRGTSAVNTGNSFSGFNGEPGHIPSVINAGEPVDVNFEFRFPTAVKEPANTKVCVMLIDAITGELINAAVSGKTLTAVDTLVNEAVAGIVFDMTGRIVMHDATVEDLHNLQPGIYILNGRKYAVK